MYHVRGVVREVKEEINAVRRELNRLEDCGIIKREERGNRVYYWPKRDHLLFGDLVSIIAKSTGLGATLIDNKSKIGNPTAIMFSGRFVQHKERRKDEDVDILFIGEINLPELATLIRKEESIRGHEINYTTMTRNELEFRKKRRDPFLLSVLSGSRVMIIGDEEGLVGGQ